MRIKILFIVINSLYNNRTSARPLRLIYPGTTYNYILDHVFTFKSLPKTYKISGLLIYNTNNSESYGCSQAQE